MRRRSSIRHPSVALAWSVIPAMALTLAACADREVTNYPEEEGIYEEPPPPPPEPEAEPPMEPMEEWPPPSEPPPEPEMEQWPTEEGLEGEGWPPPEEEGAAGERDW